MLRTRPCEPIFTLAAPVQRSSCVLEKVSDDWMHDPGKKMHNFLLSCVYLICTLYWMGITTRNDRHLKGLLRPPPSNGNVFPSTRVVIQHLIELSLLPPPLPPLRVIGERHIRPLTTWSPKAKPNSMQIINIKASPAKPSLKP